MAEEDSSRRVIENASQELLREAIRTLPLIPTQFDLSMLYGDIPNPDLLKREEMEGYVIRCITEGVIPFSFLAFIGKRFESLVPLGVYIVNYRKLEEPSRTTALDSLIAGGKIQAIRIYTGALVDYEDEVGPVFGEELFNEARGLMEKLFGKNYQLEQGYLRLQPNEGSGRRYVMSLRRNGTLELNLGSDKLKGEDKFVDWFENLEKIYPAGGEQEELRLEQ